MGKYSGGKAWLAALVVKREGKPIDGEPVRGEYTICLKPTQTFSGNRDDVVKELQAACKGCSFKWE